MSPGIQTTKYREDPFLFLLFFEVPVGLQNLSCVSTYMTCHLAQAVLYRDLVSCLIVNGGPFPPNPSLGLLYSRSILLNCPAILYNTVTVVVEMVGGCEKLEVDRRHGFLCSH